jgi:DNA-binding XRE family transcriptional regulator
MGMSQNGLGKALGVDEQTLAKWEKTGRVPKTADRFMRLFFLEAINHNVKIKDYVEQINQTDRDRNVELDLQQTNEGWKHAA